MSGGSHDYICYRIEEELQGQMHDKELDDLMEDIAQLVHDLEWFDSGDIGEKEYRESAAKFKEKWFKGNRTERLKGYIDEAVDDVKQELYKLLDIEQEE